MKSNLSPEEKNELKKQRHEHLQTVMQERAAWHRRIRLATNPPPPPLGSLDSRPPHMAIYLDGMDQDKTDIPAMGDEEAQKYGKPMKCRYSLVFCFSLCDLGLSGVSLIYRMASIPMVSFSQGRGLLVIQTRTLNV